MSAATRDCPHTPYDIRHSWRSRGRSRRRTARRRSSRRPAGATGGQLITGRFPLDRAGEAFRQFEAGAPGKFVLVMPD